MSRCNYCLHKNLVKRAAATGQVVTLVPRQLGSFSGTDALVHKTGETPDREKHFVAWYAHLPTECRC